MNAEFQWWLLIFGIVIGGALVYLVMADLRSDEREDDGDDTDDADPELDAERADFELHEPVPAPGPYATLNDDPANQIEPRSSP